MTEKDAAATPKKGKASTKVRKPKTAPSHPKVYDMVISAVSSLKERGGSSLQAIKKYIATTYKVDADKLAPFIKKSIKTSVISGTLVQTKGKGASGSFRIGGLPVNSAGTKASAKSKKATTKPKSAAKTVAKKTSKASKKTPVKSKPKKAAAPAKKSKPVAKAAVKKAKPAAKTAAKKKPAKASPKKKAAPKKAKK